MRSGEIWTWADLVLAKKKLIEIMLEEAGPIAKEFLTDIIAKVIAAKSE